ncbi:MAG: hypothetical protein AB1393_10385 [Candidatus Edwardsbacteria bacterium]
MGKNIISWAITLLLSSLLSPGQASRQKFTHYGIFLETSRGIEEPSVLKGRGTDRIAFLHQISKCYVSNVKKVIVFQPNCEVESLRIWFLPNLEQNARSIQERMRYVQKDPKV